MLKARWKVFGFQNAHPRLPILVILIIVGPYWLVFVPGIEARMGLIPQLVAGYGRSGTTALMSLLGTDSRVAMSRDYPFEDRYLTYVSKLAILLERNVIQPPLSAEELYSFEGCGLGGFPWAPPGPATGRLDEAGLPGAAEWFRSLWAVIDEKSQRQHPTAAFYAEKVPAWVSPFVRHYLPTRTFYLFRDPRDMYLSANAFMRRRNYFSFGRGPKDSDLDHARNLAYEFLLYYENFRVDRHRADCMLVPYADLIRDREGLVGRLRRFAGLECLDQAAAHGLESHRTSASPEVSLDRWRREPLPPGVLSFLETYLQESFAALHYEPAAPGKIRCCPGAEFANENENGLRVPVERGRFSIELPIDAFPSDSVTEIWVSAFGPALDEISLSWRTPERDYSHRRRLSLPAYGGPHWRVFRFPVGRHERWHGRIARLQLQMTFNSLPYDDAVYLRWVRLVE